MIDTLDRTIEQLLENELNRLYPGLEVSFSQPNGQWSGQLSGGPALNLFLYDVRENAALRRHQWQQVEPPRNGGRLDAIALKRTPLLMDCFYMVTAWSNADPRARPAQEHRLLSLALAALARYPVLNPPFAARERGEVLAGVSYQDQAARERIRVEQATSGHMVTQEHVDARTWLDNPELNLLRDVEVEIRTRVAYHDVLTNPAEVWSALEAEMKAAFSYVVTLPLDPWKQFVSYPISQGSLSLGGNAFYAIRGVIHDGNEQPLGDLPVRIIRGQQTELRGPIIIDPETDRFSTRTTATGAYGFSGLSSGNYTLLIERSPGDIVIRDLTISAAGPTGYDYTI